MEIRRPEGKMVYFCDDSKIDRVILEKIVGSKPGQLIMLNEDEFKAVRDGVICMEIPD